MKFTSTALAIILISFASCATHKHSVTQTTEENARSLTQILSQTKVLSLSEDEETTIILPKNLLPMSPISGTPSTETTESDTIKLHRRSNTIASLEDTTKAIASENTHHSTTTHSDYRCTHPPSLIQEPSCIPQFLTAIAFILVIICIYLPWKHRREASQAECPFK